MKPKLINVKKPSDSISNDDSNINNSNTINNVTPMLNKSHMYRCFEIDTPFTNSAAYKIITTAANNPPSSQIIEKIRADIGGGKKNFNLLSPIPTPIKPPIPIT